ncbi:hypothetical protein TA3x_004361 [Tundrisphaera sp. TA3]|uniref:hypothetical protein n=1 Tax=Tundrisphaera sp. TA3 TaxID=3435775 RepID=UPI003EC156DD
MTCSPARLEANRRNAARSTGPRTPAGKEKSRRNALKHGLAGDGVVLLPEQTAEVDALAATLESELQPSGPMGRILVRRIAVMSNRLDRCERHEAAMTARRVRDALKARDDARYAETDAIALNLANDPDITVRRLMRTPEGIDGLIECWHQLRGRLVLPRRFRWTDADERRVDHLLGRHPGMHPPTPFDPLLRAIKGNFSALGDDQGAGLDRKERKAWAREELARLMDGEVEALRELRGEVDDEAEAADRAEAAERALFDETAEGQTARKYEAAAERAMFRALREFREVERRAAEQAAESIGSPPGRRSSGSRPAPPAPAPTPSRTKPTAGPSPATIGGRGRAEAGQCGDPTAGLGRPGGSEVARTQPG